MLTNTVAKDSIRAWVILLSTALFFLYEFIQMNMLNSLAPFLMAEFHIGSTTLAWLGNSYLLGVILFLLPSGLMIDRFSSRIILLTMLFAAVLSTLITAYANQVWVIAVCQFVAGMGAAFGFLLCMRMIHDWFTVEKYGIAIGMVAPFAMLGGMLAQTPLTYLIHLYQWRLALIVVVLLGVVIWINAFWFVCDAKKIHAEEIKLLKSLKVAAANIQNTLCGLFTGLLNLPIMLVGSIYGSMYFMQYYQLTGYQAAQVSSMLFLGNIVGCPLLGHLSDVSLSKKIYMLLGTLASIFAAFPFIVNQQLNYTEILMLMFLLGVFTSAQVLSYPLILQNNHQNIVATANAIASVIIMLVGAIAKPLFGFILDDYWDGVMANKIPLYTNDGYHAAMMIVPIGFVLALMLLWFMKDSPKRHSSSECIHE